MCVVMESHVQLCFIEGICLCVCNKVFCVFLYDCVCVCVLSTGLTSCQQHRQRVLQRGDDAALLPVCTDSGEYQSVQCQPSTGQCWCVDQEGMEIYGTRQNGRPARCKSFHFKNPPNCNPASDPLMTITENDDCIDVD